jgi:hypothetical protein
VTTICEKIKAAGATTFRDDRDIGGGDDIPEAVRTAGLAHLRGRKTLQQVNLRLTKVTAGARDLKRHLPKGANLLRGSFNGVGVAGRL